MAKAAYCSQCGTNVYVTGEGRCPSGHGPESLSGYYEVAEAVPTQTPAVTPTKKSSAPLIIGIVIAVVVLCGLASCCSITMILPFIAEDFAVEAGTVSPHVLGGVMPLP